MLSGQTSATTLSAQVPKSNSSQTLSMSSRDWDCTGNKRIRTDQFSTKGVQEGVNEALKLLENCSHCREFFGSFDAAATLRRLMKMGAIIVSDVMPKGLPRKIEDLKLVPVKQSAAAVTIDFSTRQAGPFFKPCIYVNPKKFLVVDETSVEGFGLKDLTLTQARGVAILHELAHIADVLPSDGSVGMPAEMSIRNTTCIRKKCIACDASGKPCFPIAAYLITNQIHSHAPFRTEVGSVPITSHQLIRKSSSELRRGP